MFLVVALSIACGWLVWRLTAETRQNAIARSAELPPLWKEFLANGRPARIVIPNPIFFVWDTPREVDLMVRDTSVNDFMNIEKSPELLALQKSLGKPTLAQSYAVSTDASAALQLMHYLVSRKANVAEATSSDASSDVLENEDVILLGTIGTLTPFRNQIDHLYFKFGKYERVIVNPRPLPSEPAEFKLVRESSTRGIFPGIVALLPANSGNTSVLVLAGSQTTALVAYLTSPAGMRELEQARHRIGDKRHFEAVILSEMEGNTLLKSHLAAIRAYSY